MAGADFQVTSEAGWPLVSPQKVESPSRQWPGALPIEVNSKRSKTPLDSALSSPLDFNRYDPLKVYIAPRQLEEVESAICADHRNSGVLELFKCQREHRSRSENGFFPVPDVCFRSGFEERFGA